jgi:hypothetical protein
MDKPKNALLKTVTLELKTPIYNGYGSSSGNPVIGIAHRKLIYNDRIIIRILKEDKDGNKLFPYDFEMDCREALKYPPYILPDGITPVHIIPIKRLTQLIGGEPQTFKEVVKRADKVAKKMARKDVKISSEFVPD